MHPALRAAARVGFPVVGGTVAARQHAHALAARLVVRRTAAHAGVRGAVRVKLDVVQCGARAARQQARVAGAALLPGHGGGGRGGGGGAAGAAHLRASEGGVAS